jgi:hypothetical protein
LPISATPPALGEVLTDPSKGLSEAGKRFFAQKITEEEYLEKMKNKKNGKSKNKVSGRLR